MVRYGHSERSRGISNSYSEMCQFEAFFHYAKKLQ